MLTLLPAEHKWLDRYRDALKCEYPGIVQRMIVYGSKARGDAHEESDIDIVLIVRTTLFPNPRFSLGRRPDSAAPALACCPGPRTPHHRLRPLEPGNPQTDRPASGTRP